MKNLLKIFSFCFIVFAVLIWVSSASSCVTQSVWKNSICVSIEKWNNDRYTLESDISCKEYPCAVSCSLMLPDNTLAPVWACDGKFYYNSSSSEKVKLYITINSNFATITRYYNFRNWTWWSAIDDDDWDYDDDDDRDYDDDDDDRDYDWDDDYYDYNYNWNYSSEMNRAYQYAYRYNITTKRSIEAAWMNQQLTRIAMAKMLSQYAINVLGKRPANVYVPKFSDVSTSLDAQYDNWVTLAYQLGIMWQNMPNNKFRPYDTVTRAEFATALSRLLFNTKDWKDVYYSTHLNRLYREWIITNTNPNLKELRWYVMIMLMRSADIDTDYDYDDNYELEISTNNKNPSTSEYIRLTIDTDDDYYGRITLTAKYRSSTSSSRTSVSNTSSTYFSNYSDEWEQGYYKMKSADNGHKVISNFLKFAKKGYYRIYAKDTYGNEDYIDFYVWNSSTYNDDLDITASTTSPTVWSYIKLTIDTDSSYVWNVSFYKIQYKSSSSSSWSTISSRTNSTYFSNYSDEWEQGYYKMKSSDNGHKVISNFLKFAKKWYYRIYAKDTDWNEDYIEFNVWNSSYYYDLELSTNDRNPDASEYIDLTVTTDSYYRWKINFTAEYRSSTSNSWESISRTSSTYFTNRSTTWTNWYLTMWSSDRWEKTVENIFKFAKKGYYRIIAEDEEWNSTYLDFNVSNPSTSPLNWFTQKEFEMVESTYNTRPTLISNLRSQYPRLRNNSTWRNLSDELYENMEDVVYKRSNRVFKDYDDFDRAFRYWVSKTQEYMD